jgi:hypothetical protein
MAGSSPCFLLSSISCTSWCPACSTHSEDVSWADLNQFRYAIQLVYLNLFKSDSQLFTSLRRMLTRPWYALCMKSNAGLCCSNELQLLTVISETVTHDRCNTEPARGWVCGSELISRLLLHMSPWLPLCVFGLLDLKNENNDQFFLPDRGKQDTCCDQSNK